MISKAFSNLEDSVIWQSFRGILFDSYWYFGCIYYSICRKELLPVLLEMVREGWRKIYSCRKELASVSYSLQKVEITTLEYFYLGGRCHC